jgi:putative nucleotidyltransferase with HDIG domain
MSDQNDLATVDTKPKAKILIVEDDHDFRRVMVQALVKKGYEVRDAENGLVARTILELNPSYFDLVLSDIRMPELDGIELMRYLNPYPKVKVVLMTGFSEILESKQAFEMGASDFLNKPFRQDELVETIERCLHPPLPSASAAVEEPVESQYCAIPITQFISSSKIISDVYIRLSKDKFIKVANGGDSISVERLKTYQAKNVDFLSVRREDYGKYVAFSVKISHLVAGNRDISVARKAQLFRQTTKILVDEISIPGVEKKTLEAARQMVSDVVKTLSEDDDLLSLLKGLSDREDRLYAHSLAVSVVCSLMAKQHGWTAIATNFKVSMGALLHDIGKREIAPGILAKSRIQLSTDEIKLLESHPMRGREILSQISCLPDEIALIAYNHHENASGTGFPQGIRGDHVHPIAKLVGVADKFCSLTFPIQLDVKPLSVPEALQRMQTAHSEELDKTFLKRLLEIFPDGKEKAA